MVDEEVAIHIGEGGSGRVFRAGLFFFTGVSGFLLFPRRGKKGAGFGAGFVPLLNGGQPAASSERHHPLTADADIEELKRGRWKI